MGSIGMVGLGEEKRDMSEELAEILLKTQNFIGLIGTENAMQIKFEHLEDALAPNVISGTWVNTTDTFTPNTALTQAEINRIFRSNGTTGALGSVLTLKSGNLVIRRTVAAPPTASSSDANWEVIGGVIADAAVSTNTDWGVGLPKPDEEDASVDTSAQRSGRFGYTRVFERAVEIAETRDSWDLYAIPDEVAHQIRYRTEEMKNELNRSIINEYVKISGGAPDISNLAGTRTLPGVIQQMIDPALDNAAGTADTLLHANAAGAALAKSTINARVKAIFEAGGLDAPGYNGAIVVHPTQKQKIAAFDDTIRRFDTDVLKVGFTADKFMSDLGFDYPIVVDRAWPEAIVGILDMSRIKRKVLQQDDWHMSKMAKSGRTDKWQLSGQFGVSTKNIDTSHALIYNLSTS
jgi:hypothetical protein